MRPELGVCRYCLESKNPRQGTETVMSRLAIVPPPSSLESKNPRQGTETTSPGAGGEGRVSRSGIKKSPSGD